MKFLLLLCFTAVHVLGENQENASLKTSIVFPDNLPPLNGSHQQLETSSSSSKIALGAPVSVSQDASEGKTSPEMTATDRSSTESAATSIHSTVTLPDTTVVIRTSESSTEEVSRAEIGSRIAHTSVSTTRAASLTPGKWIINGTDTICVVVQMAVVFNISYTNVNHTESFKIFDLPVNNRTVNVSGVCDKLEQNLTLNWSSDNITNANMTLHFMKNESKHDYSFHHLDVVLPAVNFPDANLNTSMILVHNVSNAVLSLSNSYRCFKQQTLSLQQDGTNQTSGYLTISALQFQAFKTDNSTAFGLAKDCAFDTADVVPIAVGCALAGLVIIVLIAYLIGRRRNQSRGYLSM